MANNAMRTFHTDGTKLELLVRESTSLMSKKTMKAILQQVPNRMSPLPVPTRACCREVKNPNQYGGVILWCLFMYRIDP